MDETPEVHSVSRRRVVKGALGAAAAGAAAVAAMRVSTSSGTGAAAPAAAAAAPKVDTGSLPKQDWVVYVRDADNGALDVFVGEQHFPLRDSDLVARLIAAATK